MKTAFRRRVCALLCAVLSLCFLPLPVRADFTDVPPAHWAYEYVRQAEEAGAVYGIGGGLFDPESRVTEAQFYAMLIRTFLPEESPEEAPDPDPSFQPRVPWYAPYIDAAWRTGLSDGVNAASPDTPLTRLQMAQILSNLMTGIGAPSVSGEEADALLTAVPDGMSIPEENRKAVAQTYGAGVLNGMDEAGSFRGDSFMTRAQAAAVWCRMNDLILALSTPAEPEPDPVPPETFTVGGVEYAIGMSLSSLIAGAGEPDEILEAFGDYRWYVFGTQDYENRFFAAGVRDGEVVTLCSTGKAFSCPHPLTAGETLTWGSVVGGLPHGANVDTFETDRKILYFDSCDGYRLHSVFLAAAQDKKVRYYADGFSVTAEECAGESRLLFHLTNAFRIAHGTLPLIWDGAAADAARLHAEDMAARDYLSHTSPDGRTVKDRLGEQGVISWSVCAENIASGFWSAVECHAEWINSSGHRTNILNGRYVRFGAGCAAKDKTTYFVENFYSLMGE